MPACPCPVKGQRQQRPPGIPGGLSIDDNLSGWTYTIPARSRMSFSESFHPRQGSVMDLP